MPEADATGGCPAPVEIPPPQPEVSDETLAFFALVLICKIQADFPFQFYIQPSTETIYAFFSSADKFNQLKEQFNKLTQQDSLKLLREAEIVLHYTNGKIIQTIRELIYKSKTEVKVPVPIPEPVVV